MRVHLVNPSDVSFGVGVITPRWLYVLAAATPSPYGDPIITDETLEPFDPDRIQAGDVVGVGIHTANAYRGLEVGRLARERGAWVIFGGIHATLYPEEALELGAAHAVVKGDGDVVWSTVLADCSKGTPQRVYEGGRLPADRFLPARWDLLPPKSYMWSSVQTVRGCPKHCSFCSVWRTDGQRPRQRASDTVLQEIVQLRRMGYRFIALADDNFYPVTLTDIALARRQDNRQRLDELLMLRAERFELMERLAQLPRDTILFTQITMEAAEDPQFLDAMRKARIRGALVGVEAVTKEGLKAIYKDFNSSGDNLAERLQTFKRHGVYVLGSFIFGLPTEAFPGTALRKCLRPLAAHSRRHRSLPRQMGCRLKRRAYKGEIMSERNGDKARFGRARRRKILRRQRTRELRKALETKQQGQPVPNPSEEKTASQGFTVEPTGSVGLTQPTGANLSSL